MNKVGRPITKPNRIKIGLSVDNDINNMLDDLVKQTGNTKSKIFERAIMYFKSREDIIQKRRKQIEELGDDAYLEKCINEKDLDNKKKLRRELFLIQKDK